MRSRCSRSRAERRRVLGRERGQRLVVGDQPLAPALEFVQRGGLLARRAGPRVDRGADRLDVDVAHQAADVLHLPAPAFVVADAARLVDRGAQVSGSSTASSRSAGWSTSSSPSFCSAVMSRFFCDLLGFARSSRVRSSTVGGTREVDGERSGWRGAWREEDGGRARSRNGPAAMIKPRSRSLRLPRLARSLARATSPSARPSMTRALQSRRAPSRRADRPSLKMHAVDPRASGDPRHDAVSAAQRRRDAADRRRRARACEEDRRGRLRGRRRRRQRAHRQRAQRPHRDDRAEPRQGRRRHRLSRRRQRRAARQREHVGPDARRAARRCRGRVSHRAASPRSTKRRRCPTTTGMRASRATSTSTIRGTSTPTPRPRSRVAPRPPRSRQAR